MNPIGCPFMERSDYSYNILQIRYRNINFVSIPFDPLVKSLIGSHFRQLSLYICIARYLPKRTFVELGMSTKRSTASSKVA